MKCESNRWVYSCLSMNNVLSKEEEILELVRNGRLVDGREQLREVLLLLLVHLGPGAQMFIILATGPVKILQRKFYAMLFFQAF